MKTRQMVVVVAVLVVAAALWLGGQALWNTIVAMHQR